MNNLKITKHIDELGRIVIPITIRNSLSITTSDELEIFQTDNKIVITKSNIYDEKLTNIANYLTVINQLIDGEFLISNNKKIISESKVYNKLLTKDLINDINNRKSRTSNELSTLFNETCYVIYNPIIVNSNCIGLIIYKNNNKLTTDKKELLKKLSTLIDNSLLN